MTMVNDNQTAGLFDTDTASAYTKVEYTFTMLRWVFFVLALVSSFGHVRWAFALLESDNSGLGAVTAYLAAAAIEAVIALLAYQRQREKAQAKVEQRLAQAEGEINGRFMMSFDTIGLAFFMAISTVANVLHGYSTVMGKAGLEFTYSSLSELGGFDHVTVITFAATLPAVVFFLGESVKIPGEDGLVTKMVDYIARLQPTLDQTQTERDHFAAKLRTTKTALDQACVARDQYLSERNQYETERDQAEARLGASMTTGANAATERDQAQGQADRLQTELDQLRAEIARVQAEADRLQVERDRLKKKVDHAKPAEVHYKGSNDFIKEIVSYHMTDDTNNRPSQQALAKRWGLSKAAMNAVVVRANGYQPNEVQG